jgi:hypothetical protein
MSIFSDISPILNEKEEHILLANRDGVDNESAPESILPVTPGKGLKIGDQFVKSESLYGKLKSKYDITLPYFQTTCMLYDTSIIHDTTKTELFNLLLEYPISVTNDQGIIALYFTQIKPCWKQLKRKKDNLYLYDYVRCVDAEYIMVKWLDNGYLHIGYNE